MFFFWHYKTRNIVILISSPKICVTLCLVFPLDRSHCIANGRKQAPTWIRELLCLNMHAYANWVAFFGQKFSPGVCVFLLFLSFYQRIDCSDVQEHIYLHPYGSRITNSISKCIHFTVWERKFSKKTSNKIYRQRNWEFIDFIACWILWHNAFVAKKNAYFPFSGKYFTTPSTLIWMPFFW